MMASVGFMIVGAVRSSKRMSRGPYRAPHVSLLGLAIHSANLFAVLLVADLFEPVDILSAQRFLNDTQASADRR